MSLQKLNPNKNERQKTYGVCNANFVLAQKDTKKVSHMSPKSGQSVLKTKETKGI